MKTFDELCDYIDSLDAVPGCYTESELLDIGNKHKELPKVEKDWDKLAAYLNLTIKGDSLRKFISRKSAVKSHECEAVEAVEDNSTFEEEYKEKTKIRDIYNEYRLNLRKDARWEEFKDAFISAVKTLNDKYPLTCNTVFDYTTIPNIKEGKEAILPFADLHLGTEFENYFNSYNLTAAKERVSELADKVIYYCRQFDITTLHFINMGDLISGIIHPTLRITQQQNAIDSTMVAAEMVAQLLYKLSESIPHVTYRSVIDNHSRLVANVAENINEENLNRIIDWHLKTRLEDTAVEFKDDNIDLQIGKFKLNNGKLVMFSHGHNDKKTSVFQDFVGLTHEFPDYILLAHYHNKAVHTFNGCKVIISGSIIGTDTYAFDHRLFGYPEQSLLVFNGDDLLDMSLQLSHPNFLDK